MSRILALVEGHTEKKFVKEILQPYLSTKNVYISATLLGTGRGAGGVGPYQRFRRDILNHIKQGGMDYYTTMFDYYGMPNTWPGRDESRAMNYKAAAQVIEKGILDDITAELGDSFNPTCLIPYIQMHEFEALLFSDPEKLARSSAYLRAIDPLTKILEEAGEPEAINDNTETAPSKRIQKHIRSYQKTINGIIAAKEIGIETMREKCPHFRGWIDKLESLGSN